MPRPIPALSALVALTLSWPAVTQDSPDSVFLGPEGLTAEPSFPDLKARERSRRARTACSG